MEQLCGAARTIDAELRELTDGELDAFMTYVARACTLNVVDAAERGCAQTVFNTLNQRGSPLSGADIIKSDLLENSTFDRCGRRRRRPQMGETEDLFERDNFAHLLYMMPFLLTGEQLLSPGDLVTFRSRRRARGRGEEFPVRSIAALRACAARDLCRIRGCRRGQR